MHLEFTFQSRTWLNFLLLMAVAVGVTLWLMNRVAETTAEAVANESRTTGLGALRREIEGPGGRP